MVVAWADWWMQRLNAGVCVRDAVAPAVARHRGDVVSLATHLCGSLWSPGIPICCLFVGWVLALSPACGGKIVTGDEGLGPPSRGSDPPVRPLYWATVLSADSTAAATNDKKTKPEKQPESTRSAPPDTTPYVRPAIPADCAPGGREAIPPDVNPPSPQQDNLRSPCSGN